MSTRTVLEFLLVPVANVNHTFNPFTAITTVWRF